MKFIIITLGCKVNTYESEFIKSIFIDNGSILVDNIRDAEVIIINSCSVTNQADNKCAKMIRQARRENKDAILVVCGCSSEYRRELLNDLGIDILIGTIGKSTIYEKVLDYLKKGQKIVSFTNERHLPFEDMKINNFGSKTRAFVKIQDGCNNFCSYCVIPYLRKDLRSKDFLVTINEVKTLVDNGYQEIVLTGIHTGSYGINTEHDLTDLIHEISKIPNLLRIRISSIEITELNDKFLTELKNNQKIVSHLHIPLQSGNDKILKLMNRKYDIKYFIDKINQIRNIRPGINITTDVIVGFPNETDDDFLITLDNIKKINFSKVHVFPYSRRANTKADLMDGHVDENIKHLRSKTLINLSNELTYHFNKGYIGKTVNILVEGSSKTNSYGHTGDYLKVVVNKELKHNTFNEVYIKEINEDYVIGEIIN